MKLHINDELRDLINNYILQNVYPVGAIYASINAVNPRDLFGFGTWERFNGCYFMAYDPDSTMKHNKVHISLGDWHTYTDSTILNTDQIPSHSHYGLFDQSNTERFQSYGTGSEHHALINGMGVTKWHGQFHVGSTGGNKGHNHKMFDYYPVPTITLNVWKRVA